jgi:cysteine synthase
MEFQSALQVVRKFFPPTPVITAPRLSQTLGTSVQLKLECFTPIRTFKLRGALVKLQTLADQGVQGGVVTASAGNHGLAVARAARLYGRPATICVPDGANPQKIALIEAEGAKVVEHGLDYQAAFENCLRIGQEEGLALVHAYDDPAVIAGQGTIALELLKADLEFDTVLMGVGGGGLVSGVAAGSLGRVAPAFEILPDRPNRHREAVLVANQVLNGPARPQGAGDVQRLGAVVVDLVLKVLSLFVGQGAPRADGTSGAVPGQCVQPLLGVGRPPAGHGLLGDPQQGGDIGFGESQFTPMKRTQAECFEDVIGQLTSVG